MEPRERAKSTVTFKGVVDDGDDYQMYFGEYDDAETPDENYYDGDALSEESIKIAESKFECGICTEDVEAYCQVCEEYLCECCLLRHKKRKETSSHDIYHFYCSEHFKVNKIQIADRYCTGCAVYYCEKCAVMHTGFRKWRRHTFSTGLDMPFVDTINYNQSDNRQKQQQQLRSSRMTAVSARSRTSRKTPQTGYKSKQT